MQKPQVKLKMKAIRAVLKSNETQAEVARRARRMANAAGPGFESVVKPHKFTARAFVQTSNATGRRRQAKEAVLERSLDAGR
ncbi:hypothetical protein ACL9RL_09325 [Plantibacter sp. Mn2098]|uniref:hypothetical protein n=1 Tax=Plantibacter sp. Mn2098 TaxID=3395266 RepID=UPI003BBEF8FA